MSVRPGHRCLVLQRLHPLNFPIARIWAFFGEVVYWRREHLPDSWIRGFGTLQSDEHFTLDEWQRETEQAFLAWRGIRAQATGSAAPISRIHGVATDYSGAWRQWLAIEFEDRHLFAALLTRWPGARSGRVSTGRSVLDGLGIPAPSMPKDVRLVRGFASLDRLWMAARAFGIALKQMARLFLCAGSAPEGRRAVLWTGIGASEVAEEDRQLSVSFLVERGLIGADECMYMLAAAPSSAAAARLERLGVSWSTVSTFGFLPLREKLRALGPLAAAAFAAICSIGNAKRALLSQFAAESIPWLAAARSLGSRVYLTSVSVCWPERPEVAALSAMGLRTINWSYGANTFLYSDKEPEFRDLGMSRSICIAREVWIWTAEVERWLRARLLGEPPTIRVIGPVMCGDSRWLSRSPQAARAAFGLMPAAGRRLVAVFDVPPVRRELRHVPSMYPLEMLEQFFRDIESLLERLPNIAVLVKPKRSPSDTQRDFAGSMQRILDPSSDWRRSGRVIAVSHGIDPYIPVALADLCIGIPFTSPVLVALHAGRPGLFHDPLGTVNRVPGAPELMAHLTHDATGLQERVRAFLQAQIESRRPPDPGESFARLIRESAGLNAHPPAPGAPQNPD